MRKSPQKPKLKSKIQDLKNTSKGKAILKLIFWAIFFAFLFIIIIISSFIKPSVKPSSNQDYSNTEELTPEKSPEIPEIAPNAILETTTFLTARDQLLANKFTYNYEIKINDLKYIYKGTKDLTSDTGYKESSTETIKYLIDETGTYALTTTTKTPITNLYENIDSNYLNLDYLTNLITTHTFTLNTAFSSYYLYETTFDNLKIEIGLSKETTNLIFINIISDTYSYNLNYN